jgi:hypothetical protein
MLKDGRHTEKEVVSYCSGCEHQVKSPLGQYLECSVVECPDHNWGKDKTCEHHRNGWEEDPDATDIEDIERMIAAEHRERERRFLEARGLKTFGSTHSQVYEEWMKEEVAHSKQRKFGGTWWEWVWYKLTGR